MTTRTWNFAKEQAIRELANMQINGKELTKDALLENIKSSAEWHEKRLTTEPVSAQELFVNNNISQKGIDVK